MQYILCFSLLLFLTACQPKDLPTVFSQSEGYAILKVSHKTTKDELTSIADKLKIQAVEMDFSKSEFFDDGKLRNLKLSVITPEGNRGATSADQVTLQFKYFGFIYNKKGGTAFQIGTMEEF
jgi:hypothetical protein